MNMKKVIGNRITQARKARGILIKDLAERTGLKATRISNWEQGTRSPGPEEAKILSKELNVAASWLLCLTDNPMGEWLENK
ncbi:phage repressor (plasmid) [Legionella adelaidensis]|uniref:Phage repressor n=2 Tax=Legionella adelaidensis TaxID=45056 RepID=A0A0W0R5Q4_9GAMM|nr:phage repressor [Legionella adelaidensis]VEH84946.1 phage repressor [Legionella adelaidensis]